MAGGSLCGIQTTLGHVLNPFKATGKGKSGIFYACSSGCLCKFFMQSIVVQNKPGASGNLGTDLIAKAKPDGYTTVS